MKVKGTKWDTEFTQAFWEGGRPIGLYTEPFRQKSVFSQRPANHCHRDLGLDKSHLSLPVTHKHKRDRPTLNRRAAVIWQGCQGLGEGHRGVLQGHPASSPSLLGRSHPTAAPSEYLWLSVE